MAEFYSFYGFGGGWRGFRFGGGGFVVCGQGLGGRGGGGVKRLCMLG